GGPGGVASEDAHPGEEPSTAIDRDRLHDALEALHGQTTDELWLVLIGHGTFDGREARFNLRGPDVSAAELADWLEDVRRPTAIVNCASASGSFIERLSAADRVIVTATKSGYEHNYARFGEFMSQAIGSKEADLDKDGQTSLLEGWLLAARRTEEFYRTKGRLATEHALLDDNADAAGSLPESFDGVRPAAATVPPLTKGGPGGVTPDGLRAHQFHLIRGTEDERLSPEARARRDALELELFRLRTRKAELPEKDYAAELERILLDLARLYEAAVEQDEESQ
ncbi:MAG: hypothetical protein KY476_05935, partial [Planctomycetes bacterium]|nr:hypothetical protein [Planctomycetota bacterium]